MKKIPAIYRRATASASARAARIARAAAQLRAGKGAAATPMRWPSYGGQGGYGAWRTLLPGSDYEYEAAAGNLSQNSAVAACLGWIRNNFPEPTLEVVKSIGDGQSADNKPMRPGRGKKSTAGAVRVVAGSKAVALLDRPNPYFDRYTFWSACSMSLVVDGNCYIRKIRDRRRKVVQLWHIPSWMCSPRWAPDGSEYISWYEYRVNGTVEPIDVADMVHLKHGDDDRDGDRLAWSPLKAACREVCGLNDAAGFTASLMRNMGIPGVIISSAVPDGSFPADELPILRNQFREQFSGEGRGSAMFSPMPIKVEKITFSPEELALDKIPAQLEAMICALIGVPAMVVGLAASMDRRTFSNYGEARRAAYEDCLIPLQKKVAEGLTNQLLVPDFGDEGDRFRWDYSGVQCMLENEDLLADRLGKVYQVYQGITRAEFRQAMGYDWTDDDEVFYPEAMLRITDREDLPGEGANAGGPNEIAADDADADAKQVDVTDQIAKDMQATGSKKSETIDKQLKEQGLGESPATGSGRSAPGDAADRAIGPKATHKASSAGAILAHALKGRGWTARHRDDTLTFDERHDLLGDVSAYATDWLRHETTAFFEEYGHDDDERGDRGAPEGIDGQVVCRMDGDAMLAIGPDDRPVLRSIDPAAAAHLRRLFARCKQFCREASLAGATALAGPARLTAEDLADLEASSTEQDRFFDGFLNEILTAPPDALDGSRVLGIPMSPDGIIGRFGKYGRDIWRRGINWLRGRFRRGQKVQLEARVLGAVKEAHCEDCPKYADMGFVPVGSLPAIGEESECGPWGCRCSFRYKEGSTTDIGTPTGPDAG